MHLKTVLFYVSSFALVAQAQILGVRVYPFRSYCEKKANPSYLKQTSNVTCLPGFDWVGWIGSIVREHKLKHAFFFA